MNRYAAALALGVICFSCLPPARKCAAQSDCAAGEVCSAGECRGSSAGSGGSGGSGGAGGPMGMVFTGCDPANPANASLDTDCDGISDAEEYAVDHGGGAKTDPCDTDSDDDGLPDGIEVGKVSAIGTCSSFVGDADPRTTSNPTVADSDGDGLSDGEEDTNKDGKRDPGETDGSRRDSDCDGYSDADERTGAAGCNTDPTVRDTDGDGLADGIEGGLTPPGADPACMYNAQSFDSDIATKTNACDADSDSDGIQDGAEDSNQNGRVDMGELDPNNGTDSVGPATAACATANLKPVNFQRNTKADVQVALAPGFTEVATVTQGGEEKGIVFFDPTNNVGGIAVVKVLTQDTTATAQEQAGRTAIGGVSNPLVQTFRTWDLLDSARASYTATGSQDLKTKLNALATSLVGAGATGFAAGGGAAGPYRVQAQYTLRTPRRVIVLMAIVPAATATNQQQLFRLDDVGGGSALAQFGDTTAVQCEVFNSAVNQQVDFLWVVDDSGSMGSSQTAVARAGNLFGSRLTNAGIDWRAGGVSTGWYSSGYAGSFRDFTSTLSTFLAWFSGSSRFGTGGSATERGFAAAQVFIGRTHGSNNPGMFRPDSAVHLIFLSDTKDQSSIGVAEMTTYLDQRFPGREIGRRWQAHAIVCPEGSTCGDAAEESEGKYHKLVRNSGGVLGSITTFNPANPNATQTAQQDQVIDAILGAAIGATGKQLQRQPINPTIKVAVGGLTRGVCNASDVPRDRTNGWDIDSASRRLVFFGNCIPAATGQQIAVSYKYWVDTTPNPDNGDPCATACQACGTAFVCNRLTCLCEPKIE